MKIENEEEVDPVPLDSGDDNDHADDVGEDIGSHDNWDDWNEVR